MSFHVVEELRTTIEQNVKAPSRGSIKYIRPMLYLHNDPAGTFYLKIYEGSTLLGTASTTMTAIKLGAGLSDNQYHWGAVRFTLDNSVVLKRKVTYKLEISATSYTFSESSYFGLIKPYENLINETVDDFTTTSDYENPIGTQVFIYENIQ